MALAEELEAAAIGQLRGELCDIGAIALSEMVENVFEGIARRVGGKLGTVDEPAGLGARCVTLASAHNSIAVTLKREGRAGRDVGVSVDITGPVSRHTDPVLDEMGLSSEMKVFQAADAQEKIENLLTLVRGAFKPVEPAAGLDLVSG